MSSKKKPLSVAEKISDLITAVPKTIGSDDEFEETKAKVVDFDDEIDDDDDFQTRLSGSSIRRKNASLLEESDKRYAGKKVSRKEIFSGGMSSEESNEDDDQEENYTDDGDGIKKGSDESNEENDDVSPSDEEEQGEEAGSDKEGDSLDGEEEKSDVGSEEEDKDDNDDESDIDDDFDDSLDLSNPLLRRRDQNNGIKTVSATNVRAEIEKGNCVREQLKLWENLLEMRIKLQKCLISSNKLPQYEVYENYTADADFKKGCNTAKKQLSGLLSNLLDLQSNLLSRYPETKNILSGNKKRKDRDNGDEEEDNPMDEEIPSDTDEEMNGNEEEEENADEGEEDAEESEEDKKGPARKKIKLSEFEKTIAKNHKAYTDYRDSVIQKWNDKTRIASGVIGKGVNQPVVKQIEFALANKDKLLKKTQLKRSEYDIIGKAPVSVDDNDGRRTQEYDTEIYDDDDFYHQLLRELIEYKSADITDPIQLSKTWIQLQNMRSKMKRKIDTRATKGRRIRYDVHQKLVNYMAPISVFDTWTDHSKNELYSSLFGKMKSVNQESKSS